MSLDNQLYTRLLTDTQALVQSLDLVTDQPSIVASIGRNVYVLTRGANQRLEMTYPSVLVTNEGQAELELPSDFVYDHVEYPVSILIYDQPTTPIQEAQNTYRAWRHQIAVALRGLVNRPILPDCPELYDVRVQNGQSIPAGVPARDQVVSVLTAMYKTAELRQKNVPV